MTEIYGTAWINKHGDSPNETWARKILSIDPMAVKHGLELCTDDPSGFAPTLGQFSAMCGGYAKRLAHTEYKPLPKPPCKKETADDSMAEIRRKLGIRK